MCLPECLSRSRSFRSALKVPVDHVLTAFFGKLIPTKNPEILLDALQHLYKDLSRISIFYVGTGALAGKLAATAHALYKASSVNVHFSECVNQSALPDYYLLSEIVVLSSNFSGETWGLVFNKSLQAGCIVIVSDAVGGFCVVDFSALPHLKSFSVGSSTCFARSFLDVIDKTRDCCWAKYCLTDYSQEANLRVFAHQLHRLSAP